MRGEHACGRPDKLTTAGCASGLRTICTINDPTQAAEEHGPSTTAAPVQLRRDFCNVPNTNHQDLWDRADPAWMGKSVSYWAHAHQKNDELNREELQQRLGRFKKARAPMPPLWAATHAPTTLLRSTAASRRPWSAFADPILGLRGGPRPMYPDLADEASEELASEARISARRAVAFDPAQYVLNCTGANASPTLARTRLTEVARSLGAAPAPAQVVG